MCLDGLYLGLKGAAISGLGILAMCVPFRVVLGLCGHDIMRRGG